MSESLGITHIGRFDYSPILAGDRPQSVTLAVTLKAGRVYKPGSVLGYIDATGLCDLVDSTATDGTERPYAVLAGNDRYGGDVDAMAGNTVAVAWIMGEFAREFLTFGGTDTWQTHARAARDVGLIFRKTATAPNE
jgi:hypothetical protein